MTTPPTITLPDVARLIETLQLQPHPEGGYYRETWRHDGENGARGAGTAIYYLLAAGQKSHWHRVDAAEIWHYYSGDPLQLSLYADGEPPREVVLGPDLAAGQVPQLVIPAGVWQAAAPLGRWTLCGCTVSPAFDFAGFEMAAPQWQPPGVVMPQSLAQVPAITADVAIAQRSRHLQHADLTLAWRWNGAAQRIEGEVQFGTEAEGLPGHVHGGLLSTLCDEAMGWACWMSGHVAPGGRVSVDFLRPARTGQAVQLTAWLAVAVGRKLHLCAEIRSGEAVLARATGLYVSIQPRDWTPFAGWPGRGRFGV